MSFNSPQRLPRGFLTGQFSAQTSVSAIFSLLAHLFPLITLCLPSLPSWKLKVWVAQLCLTLCNSMDCGPASSSVQGILQARILEWVAMPRRSDLPDPGIKPGTPALQADSQAPRKPLSPQPKPQVHIVSLTQSIWLSLYVTASSHTSAWSFIFLIQNTVSENFPEQSQSTPWEVWCQLLAQQLWSSSYMDS